MTESKKLTGKEAQEFFDAAQGKEKIADETRKKIGGEFFAAVMGKKPENPAQQPTPTPESKPAATPESARTPELAPAPTPTPTPEPENPFALPDSIKPRGVPKASNYKKTQDISLEGHKTHEHHKSQKKPEPPESIDYTDKNYTRREFGKFIVIMAGLGLAHQIATHKPDLALFKKELAEGLSLIDIKNIFDSIDNESELQKNLAAKGYIKDSITGNYIRPDIYQTKAKNLREEIAEISMNGTKMYDSDGRPIKLKKSVAEAFLMAYAEMLSETGERMIINSSFRTNHDQARLVRDKQKDPEKNQDKVVSQIGTSPHEAGQALDVQNWREAQKYLQKYGFVGGYEGMEKDMLHFDIGFTKKRDFLASTKQGMKDRAQLATGWFKKRLGL